MKNLTLQHKFNIMVFLLFCLAFLLRVYNIGLHDLWRDESFSVNVAGRDILSVIKVASRDTQPPFHMAFLHYWMKIFGNSEISVRFVSLIFSMLSVFYIYKLGTEVFKRKRDQILLLIFAVTNQPLIFYAQEARSYSMLTAFSAGFLFYGQKLSRDPGKLNYAGFVLMAVLGLYSHNIFTVVIFSYGLYNLVQLIKESGARFYRSKNFKIYALLYAAVVLLYLPWVFVLLDQFNKVNQGGFWLKFHPVGSVLGTQAAFFTGLRLADFGDLANNFLIAYIGLFGLSVSSLGFAHELKRAKRVFPAYSFIVITMLASIFLISFKVPFYYVRYMVFVLPPLLIICVYGLKELSRITGKNAAYILFLAFVICNSVFFLSFVSADRNSKPAYREAILFLQREFVSGTDIIIHPHAGSYHSFYYYNKVPSHIYNPDRNLPYFEGIAAIREKDYFDGDLTQFEHLWVARLWADEGFEERLVNMGFSKVFEKDFDNLHVALWEI